MINVPLADQGHGSGVYGCIVYMFYNPFTTLPALPKVGFRYSACHSYPLALCKTSTDGQGKS